MEEGRWEREEENLQFAMFYNISVLAPPRSRDFRPFGLGVFRSGMNQRYGAIAGNFLEMRIQGKERKMFIMGDCRQDHVDGTKYFPFPGRVYK